MKTITVKAEKNNISVVTEFTESFLEECDCPMKAQMQISIVIDELFSNIANYAYGDGEGDVTVSEDFDSESRNFSITFTDTGIPYNPLEKTDPDITLSADERKIGGLGIFIVKNTMDEITYKNENGKNILSVIKKI